MIRPLLIIFVLIATHSFGQINKIFIKGDFYNKPLLNFIQEIENAYDVQFHYVNDVVKDVYVNGIIKNNTPLLDALEILLRDKPISFSANQQGQIILFGNEKKIIKAGEKLVKLSGQVTDKGTGNPLPFVTIFIPGEAKGAVTDDKGMFEIKPLQKGLQLVQFSFVGYNPLSLKIELVDDLFITADLEENALQLKELVITPSIFEITTAETPLTLGKEEILHSPNMGKDIYRTLRALPGIANNDYSSKARIRGGHSDETAIYLDHLLINDPFHLEEVDGTFSIFNTDYVDELTLLTGGFSSKYTDRLSGVIDVKTSDQFEGDRYRLSVDLMNFSLLVQKKITNKVNFFFTARKGYLDFLLRKMDTEDTDILQPRFSDLWGKVTYTPSRKHNFTFNVLAGRDNFRLRDHGGLSAHLDLANIRNNINGWANWKWFPSEKLNSITTFAYQSQDKDASFIFPESISPDNIDNNQTNSVTLSHHAFYDVSKNSSFEGGFEFKGFTSQYRYKETRYDVYHSTADNVIVNDLDIDRNLNGYIVSAYLQHNWTVREGLILQPGLRASSQQFSREVKWAPRFAASYTLSPSFTVKLAYGIYYQPDLYFKLRTALFQETPYSTNSKSIHYNGSLTYSRKKTNISLNVYYKDYQRLFDDYRFEFFNRLGGVNILDVSFNTTSGFSKGAELMIRQQYGKNSTLSISYAYARSRIQNTAGDETFRDFDQPHTIIVNNVFRLPRNWNISLLWTYHTGYPFTPTQVGFIRDRPNEEGIVLFYKTGKKNSARLPDFHSLDIRMEKVWHFKKTSFMAYLNIVNFYNRENIRSYWWFPYYRNENNIGFDAEKQVNIPLFVSPGISFTLY